MDGRVTRAWCLLSLLALAGCTGTLVSSGEASTDLVDAGADTGVDAGLPLHDAGGPDVAPPDGGDSLSLPFAAPCLTGADCASGMCAELITGASRCTAGCESDADCAGGWDCGQAGSGEFTYRACLCAPSTEVCDDLDNDCDGVADEDLDCCVPDTTRACGDGYCTPGTQRCGADGVWGACEGGTRPSPEVCDGLDNDCDASTVDGAMEITLGTSCTPTSCPTAGCRGTISCEPGGLLCVVVPDPPPVVLRTVELSPTETLEGADLKVVLIVDNSASMREEQERMALGVRNMMASLRTVPGLALRFYIYTTDSYWPFSGDKTSWRRVNRSTWSDGSVHTDGAAPPDRTPYDAYYGYELAPPWNNGSELVFRADLSDAEYATKVDELEAAVRAVGIEGTDYESAFCTMSQTLVGLGDNPIFEPGDKAAFVILSDTDDYDGWYWCSGYTEGHYEWQTERSSRRTDNVAEAISARYEVQTLQYEYYQPITYVDPETRETRMSERWSLYHEFDPTAHGVANVCPTSPQPCPASLVDQIIATDSPSEVRRCSYQCRDGWSRTFAATDLPLAPNYCMTGYTVAGRSYPNIVAEATAAGEHPAGCSFYYIAESTYERWNSTSGRSYYSQDLLPPHERAWPSGRSILDRLTEALPAKFGAGNYFVSAVINHASVSDASCNTTSEGVGNRYNTFVDGLGEQGVKQSICDTDYSSSMAGLAGFITHSIQQTFRIPLAAGEAFGTVRIRRADGSVVEVAGANLRIVGEEVTVTGALRIETGDVLMVEIVRAD